MKLIPYLFIFMPLFINCECFHSDDEEGTCYEFDRRQCNGDEWAEIIPVNDAKADQESKMKVYLESKDISVEEVNLVEEFHENVCEACFICPLGDRFYVRVSGEADSEKLADLELLSFGKVDCEDVL